VVQGDVRGGTAGDDGAVVVADFHRQLHLVARLAGERPGRRALVVPGGERGFGGKDELHLRVGVQGHGAGRGGQGEAGHEGDQYQTGHENLQIVQNARQFVA
jgi:hypothetical protein